MLCYGSHQAWNSLYPIFPREYTVPGSYFLKDIVPIRAEVVHHENSSLLTVGFFHGRACRARGSSCQIDEVEVREFAIARQALACNGAVYFVLFLGITKKIVKIVTWILQRFAFVIALLILYGTLLFSTIFVVVSAVEVFQGNNRSDSALLLAISLLVLAFGAFGIIKFRETEFFRTTPQDELFPFLMISLYLIGARIAGDWAYIYNLLLPSLVVGGIVGGAMIINKLKRKPKSGQRRKK